MRSKFVVASLLLSVHTAAFARTKPHYIFLLPDGYIGWIQVISLAPGALPPVVEKGNLLIEIDDKGVFRTPTYHTYFVGAHDEFFYKRLDSHGRPTRVPVPASYVCAGMSGLDSCYSISLSEPMPKKIDAYTVSRATLGRPGPSSEGNSWFLFVGPPEMRAKASVPYNEMDVPENDPKPGRLQ